MTIVVPPSTTPLSMHATAWTRRSSLPAPRLPHDGARLSYAGLDQSPRRLRNQLPRADRVRARRGAGAHRHPAFPVGLNALVLAADDADGSTGCVSRPAASWPRSRLRSRSGGHGFLGNCTRGKVPHGRLAPDALPSGRLYFCQHLTRDLVGGGMAEPRQWRHGHRARCYRVDRSGTAAPRTCRDVRAKRAQGDASGSRSTSATRASRSSRLRRLRRPSAPRRRWHGPRGLSGRPDNPHHVPRSGRRRDGTRRQPGVRREIGRLVVPAEAALDTTLEFIER